MSAKTDVTIKYQIQATTRKGMVWKVFEYINCTEYKRSVIEIMLTNDVTFSTVITSLPVGGIITRTACGNMTLRIVVPPLNPSDCAASTCPAPTEDIPERIISPM